MIDRHEEFRFTFVGTLVCFVCLFGSVDGLPKESKPTFSITQFVMVESIQEVKPGVVLSSFSATGSKFPRTPPPPPPCQVPHELVLCSVLWNLMYPDPEKFLDFMHIHICIKNDGSLLSRSFFAENGCCPFGSLFHQPKKGTFNRRHPQ